jgi:hypothetical protein
VAVPELTGIIPVEKDWRVGWLVTENRRRVNERGRRVVKISSDSVEKGK